MTAAIACGTPSIPPIKTNQKACLLKLLICGQDRSLCRAYSETAAGMGYSAAIAGGGEQMLYATGSENIDVILLDFNALVARGLEIVRHIKTRQPGVEVIVTASVNAETAVQVMKLGAYECLPKPFSLDQLRRALGEVAARLKSKTESRLRCEQLKTSEGFGAIVGRTAEMEKLYRLISKASQSSHPVLVLGESGTGKEMVARAIHYSGAFRDKPFVPVDCGSLVPSLIESELFGYVKGAFTGAAQSREGLFTIADGATVFLDEIGELATDLQAKLLRVLQEKEVRPVGSTKSVPVNVRILAATNRDLEKAVGQGLFRLDLFYRLNVLNLRVPPLRERREDIPLLATRFLERCSRLSGRKYGLSDEAMRVLAAHDWPGNVRELENCIERCCVMSSGPVIHDSDLPRFVSIFRSEAAVTGPQAQVVRLSELEKQTILNTVRQLNGDKMMAANLLGIGKTTLYRKLKQFSAEIK